MKHLLWIDGGAAALAGILLLLLGQWLNGLLGLPAALLGLIGTVNLLYAVYALNLARRQRRRQNLVVLLALANLAWAMACVALAVNLADSASLWGLAYLLGEGLFVTALACLEWRWRERLCLAT